MALRTAVLRHFRVPVQTLTGSKHQLNQWSLSGSLRLMSSHDDHLTKEDVIQRVLSVVKSFPKVNPAQVTPDVHFQTDLGLDSLDNVEIVMALEEEFKLEIPDLEADKIDSFGLGVLMDLIPAREIENNPNLSDKGLESNGCLSALDFAKNGAGYIGFFPCVKWELDLLDLNRRRVQNIYKMDSASTLKDIQRENPFYLVLDVAHIFF